MNSTTDLFHSIKIIIFIICTALFLLITVRSELTRGPSDSLAVVGSTVVLHCSTNFSVPVQWEFKRFNHEPNEPWALVYFGYPVSQITAQYRNKNKYSVTVDSTGNEYNLMIYNLQTDDAGTYRCIDDYGFGGHKHDEGLTHHEYRAQVAVIEKDLICYQTINGYEINKENITLQYGDVIGMNCTFHYTGNFNPLIHWAVIESKTSIEILHKCKTDVRRSNGLVGITSDFEVTVSKKINRCRIKCIVTAAGDDGVSFSVAVSEMQQLSVDILEIIVLDKESTFDIATPTELSTIKEPLIWEKEQGFLIKTIAALTIMCTLLFVGIASIVMWIARRRYHKNREKANRTSSNYVHRHSEELSIVSNPA